MPAPMTVEIEASDAYERGRQRGRQVGARLEHTWPRYERLFVETARAAGREPVDVAAIATACLDELTRWRPDARRELEGVAVGAETSLTTVAALNARTEVLAQSGVIDPSECSTIVQVTEPVRSAQTWDWHADFADGWHLQRVRGDRFAYAGLAEHGMLAKIGVNEAGLGVHLNILAHHRDVTDAAGELVAPRGGVPVHLIAQRLLAETSTVEQAVGLVRSAPVCASTVLTVVTRDDAACLEISPAGVAVITPADGWLVHTNHFLDADLAAGERQTVALPTTYDREHLLRTQVKALAGGLDVESLVAVLLSHDVDGVSVCCHPDVVRPAWDRRATLATIGIDVASRTVYVSAGGPCRRADPVVLTAG